MNRITINKQINKILLFLFFAFLSFNATAQNDKKQITIQNKNISLKEAFAEIELQTGHDRDRNSFFHFTDNADIQVTHVFTVVCEVCFQEEHV